MIAASRRCVGEYTGSQMEPFNHARTLSARDFAPDEDRSFRSLPILFHVNDCEKRHCASGSEKTDSRLQLFTPYNSSFVEDVCPLSNAVLITQNSTYRALLVN